jgi:hypothetical protein
MKKNAFTFCLQFQLARYIKVLDFTTDTGAFSTFLQRVPAISGYDRPEDIAGALSLACGLPWQGGHE